MLDVKWTLISPLTHSSRPLRSLGVRVQSSASALLIFVSRTGGCGGFFFSCRFIGTTGYGSGGAPSDEEIWAGGGLGMTSGGGSGGLGSANASGMEHPKNSAKATREKKGRCMS